MRRRKNELPAMLALTILLSGISEQPAHQSYVYAEQIEAPEDLNRTSSGGETQPDAGNMVRQMEHRRLERPGRRE